ncbi:polysaccharide deacetylase family protein [Deinococcus sp. Leaf326]|uniref:polysaccharide deacetylase family protein n=1 Tax=Deinococcus sp. Leaf326 TaxID=1736338 RepID=UPI001F18C673|nr:polysaccharide deacetylase family protein [Deinococcus sp. Leaf326]
MAGARAALAQLPLPAAAPAGTPGQVQPVAPGTRPAPAIPTLTLTPPVPQVYRTEYLSNGFIEVAHAVITLTPAERPLARVLAATVAARVFAARPTLAEVDLSVYDKGSYAGFGGPLPLLTASVPQARLGAMTAWALGQERPGQPPYDRAWVNPGNLPAYREPDRVREVGPTLVGPGSPSRQSAAQIAQTTARIRGGLQGGFLYRARRGTEGLAALTFDDAPHPMYEPLLLDLLRRAGAKATFFVIGRNAAAYPYFVRDMAAQGHEVANHTYHHVRLPPLPTAEATDEMRWANEVLQGLTGKPVRYFRPPGGEYTPATLAAAQSLGLTTVFWTDDPGDFQNPGDALLGARLRRNLRPGGIVLLHDNAPQTLDVLREFLRVARRSGINLTTVGGLPK